MSFICKIPHIVCSAVLHHKTENTIPPGNTPGCMNIGSYCIKAYTDIKHVENQQTERTVEGYSHDLKISDHVNTVCDRFSHQMGEKYICGVTKLTFLGPVQSCDGTVYVKEKDGKLVHKKKFL